MDEGDRITIERIGGFTGFGLPGSHLKSRGEIAASALSEADRKAIDALFARGAHKAAIKPDGFAYRLTRGAATVEVPEDQVPAAVRDCVKDTLD